MKENFQKETELAKTNELTLEEAKERIKSLEARIEADKNAIMQIQFEAKQNQQEKLDLRNTYVWQTGLKIEKILQKTGFAFARSLLEIADYKRMGLMVTLRKGLNEGLNRENVAFCKKRRLSLCRQKFLRFKKVREVNVPLLVSSFSVPKEKGLVSIVLPVYNGGEVLKESIKSVLGQTYKNFELIVVNDGSTDKSLEIAKAFAKTDSRIKIINQENKKLPTALSVGFRHAKGEFFTWTSADNIMLKDCLQIMVSDIQKKPDVSMVYGNMRLIDGRGRIKRGRGWFEKPMLSGNVHFPKDTRALNTYANNTIGAAFLYRAEAAYILGDYSKHKTNLEDYDYWMRMNSLLKIDHIDEEKPIYLYRIHEDSLTAHDRELGITKNRYKLMVWDDFRRDFYTSGLVWIVDAEDEENPYYKEFIKKADDLGNMRISIEDALSCGAPKEYSCFCYVYFGENPNEETLKKMSRFSGMAVVSQKGEPSHKEMFDVSIMTGEAEQNEVLPDYKGAIKANDGKAIFDILDSRLKNDILYGLEKTIDDPPEYEKKISIIICTYLRGEKLVDAIWSVIRQSLSKKEYEIIVVDNAPFTSGIRKEVEAFQEKYKEFEGFIRYIGVPQKGLSYARNGGMWNAKGEYLLFLDDDVLADYHLLEEIYSGFKYHPNVGIVGGQIILDKPFPTPKVVRKGWESLWSQFKISGNTFREVSQQFEFPYGANYGVRRSAIWQIGGFRMCYGRVGNDFAGGEETALAFKMLQIGSGIGLQPRAKVLHRVDPSRFTTEHIKKTIMAGTITTYRFFVDLHTSIGWTKRYVKEQIRITNREISILTKKNAEPLDIYYKKCYLDAWKRLLGYMDEIYEED